MNEELQNLRRRKSREYRKNKRSNKYLQLHKEFIKLKLKNTKKYIKKQVEILRDTDPRKYYQKI